MDISCLLGIVLVSLVLTANKTIAVCQPKRKEFALEFTNKILVGQLLGSPVAMEEMACQLSCHANDFCDAYNYHTKTGQCELLDGRASVKLEPANQDWKCRAQKCEADSCKNGGTCFHFNDRPNCVCPVAWKGELCDVPIHDIVMSFPGGSIDDFIVYENPFSASLTGLTVSMKLQLDRNTEEKLTPMSYTTRQITNDVIAVKSSPTVTMIGILSRWSNFEGQDALITDSNCHHLLFTWTRGTGTLVLYIDGFKSGVKENVAAQKTIEGGGALVLGQDQDKYMGDYDPAETLRGSLTSLNIWDRVLTVSEIEDLSSKYSTQEGNIVKWSQLRILPGNGNVKKFQTLCVLP